MRGSNLYALLVAIFAVCAAALLGVLLALLFVAKPTVETPPDYRPLPLSTSNPYAYLPWSVPPKTRIPGVGTPADDDLAATGKLLLFRIPADSYEDGVLELVIHDARDPQQRADLVV
jgi:hypothetical protein